MTKKYLRIITYFLIFIAIFAMVSLYVPTHDDFFMPCGSDIKGAVAISSYLENGRFVGNFFGTLLSLRPLLNALVKTVTFMTIIIGICYLVDGITTISLVCACLLFVFPSYGIIAQCYNWSMGFYNYTMGVACFILVLCCVKYYNSSNKNSCAVLILISVLSICQMLFAENESVIFLCLALILFATELRNKEKNGNSRTVIIIYLISSLIGFFLLFYGPKLLNFGHKFGGYRSVFLPESPISYYIISRMNQYFQIQGWVLEYYVFWITLFAVMLYSIIRGKKSKHEIYKFVIIISLYIVSLLLKNHVIPIQKWNISNMICCATVTILEFLLVLWNYEERKVIAVLLMFIGCAEMVFVDPCAERCMFVVYALLSYYLLCTISHEDFTGIEKIVIPVIIIPTVCLYAYLYMNFREIKNIDIIRENNIAQQMSEGKKEIDVVLQPDSKLLWMSASLYGYPYTYYYDTPGDISFNPISYEEYLKKTV